MRHATSRKHAERIESIELQEVAVVGGKTVAVKPVDHLGTLRDLPALLRNSADTVARLVEARVICVVKSQARGFAPKHTDILIYEYVVHIPTMSEGMLTCKPAEYGDIPRLRLWCSSRSGSV